MKAEVLKIVNAASSEVSQSPLMLQLYRITQKLRQKWLVNFINLHVSSYGQLIDQGVTEHRVIYLECLMTAALGIPVVPLV